MLIRVLGGCAMSRLVRSVRSPILLVTAIAVLVVSVFGTAVLGTAPAASESGAGVIAWFRDHATGVRWFVWAGSIGVPLYAVMIALLRVLLPVPHRDVFLIGGIVLLVATSLQSWIWAGLALHAGALDAAVARGLLNVAIYFGPV
jgi:hypothetical protein